MNEAEEVAKKILIAKGWNPKKIESHTRNKGLPDFITDKGYVEVKYLYSNLSIMINENQLTRWNDLLHDNKKIFLMIISHSYEYLYMFEVKEIK